MHSGVQKAISMIRSHYYEPITLETIAAEAFFSPFHFSRVFSKETGVTPGRYLTAVRLFEAKRMLLTTSRTVADVVCSVGYSSVGTFTSRFTRTVGMTPTQYRSPEVGELLVAVAPDFHRIPSPEDLRRAGRHCVSEPLPGTATVTGTIELPPEAAPANILVGLFEDRIPQRAPVAYTYLAGVGSSKLQLHDVPEGRWSAMAIAESTGDTPGRRGVCVSGAPVPVTVSGGRGSVRLRMRSPEPSDPPIAITLASRASFTSNDPAGALRTAA